MGSRLSWAILEQVFEDNAETFSRRPVFDGKKNMYAFYRLFQTKERNVSSFNLWEEKTDLT